ncbi:hypothetical protein BCR44DRAFT_127179 [Catenaria anguillulae PL171]|uniref:Uncharacterized protein n=1 Tax=Catenaria anguillulae PL171 TaxID=765915 RepID=A0A1Y2HRP0_9FUNG|nr:hypothetical protein BCR44DRAFT_127179 [Catenaria anguillulae PL171]
MTATEKHLPHPPPGYDFTDAVAVLSLHKGDTVRFTGIDESTAQALQAAISGVWRLGIQESHWSGGTSVAPKYYKLKFRGNPWSGQGSEAVPARKLMVTILRTLLAHGWRVEATCDLSKSQWDKDSFVMMRVAPQYLGPSDMFAVSFNMSDRLRLIDAPEAVASVVHATVLEYWAQGIQGTFDYCGSLEYKLRGNPWLGYKDESIAARVMMAKVLARLKNIGYSLYASVDISMGHEGRDLDSWILIRDPSN